MAEFTYLRNVTSKCIYCSNLIIKWNYGGAELNMFCALSKDMRTEECSFFELVRNIRCRCGHINRARAKFCEVCGERVK